MIHFTCILNIPQDIDPAVAAIAMEAMLEGFLYECLAEPGHKVHSEAEFSHAIETLISLIDRILQSGKQPIG